MRQRVRSGTPTPLARRQGAAATAREESGVPEGGSSAEGAAAAIALPGASTVATPLFGAWFSCRGNKTDDINHGKVLEEHKNKKVKDLKVGYSIHIHLIPQ